MTRIGLTLWLAALLIVAGSRTARADDLDPAVRAQIPAWFAEAEANSGKDAAAAARHLAWRIGYNLAQDGGLDGDRLRLASREVQRLIYERYEQPVDRTVLHQVLVGQAFDAAIKRESRLPAYAQETVAQRKARIVRRGIEWLPGALVLGGDTAGAAWEIPNILRSEFAVFSYPKTEVATVLTADAAWIKTQLPAASYAIVFAAAPNRGEPYADLGRAAYEAALDSGATEAEAKQLAIRAMALYAKRISETDRTEFFVGLHAGRIVDAAYAYTEDEEELLRLAREAVSYGGGGTAAYERLRDDIRRRAGTLDYPPVPPDSNDLHRLRDALNLLDSEMAVLAENESAQLDPVIAEALLDHLTTLSARFGEASELNGAPWERRGQPQPESMIGWMKAYRYLYAKLLVRLTSNSIITDEQILEVKNLLILQQTLMEINQTLMDYATFQEFVSGGALDLADDVKKLMANPDVPGISRALETISKLDKAWSYAKSPIKLTEAVQRCDWESPEAATVFDGTGITGKDLGSIAEKIAKASHEQARDTRKALRVLREDMEKLLAMHANRQGEHIPSILKSMRERNTVGAAMSGAVKSRNLQKLLNSILVPIAKADHAARVQELRDLEALSRSDQQHLQQVRLHFAETAVRAEQERELADRLRVSLRQLTSLYLEKAYRSYDFPPSPAPALETTEATGDFTHDSQLIGTALTIYNGIVGTHTESVRVLAPHLILPPAEDPRATAHRVLIGSDFQSSDDGWFVSGEGLPTRKARWLNGAQERGNRVIGAREPQEASGALDVVLVVDVSMSMKDAMNSIKQASTVLVRDLSGSIKDLRLGLVAYTDVQAEGDKAIRTSPLMADLNEQMAAFQSLTLGSGGATDAESQYDALAVALERFQWRRTTADGLPVGRAIIVITDAGSIPGARTQEQIVARSTLTHTRIFSMIQGDDSAAWALGRSLTASTGGALMSLRDPQQAAADLVQAMIDANEALAPRYFVSPAKYGGDRSSAHHYTLSYRIRQSGTRDQFDAPDVILMGKSLTVTYTHPVRPSTRWTQVHIPLHSGRGWTNLVTGMSTTDLQLQEVLSDLVQIKIRAEYQSGDDHTVLDDVRLYGRPQIDLELLQRNILSSLARWESTIIRRARILQQSYDSTDVLEKRLQIAGVKDPALYIQLREPQKLLDQAFRDAAGKHGPFIDLYSSVLQHLELTRRLLEEAKTDTDQLLWINDGVTRAEAQWQKEAAAYEQELKVFYEMIIADGTAFDRAPSVDSDRRQRATMLQQLRRLQSHSLRQRDYLPPQPLPSPRTAPTPTPRVQE